MTQEEIATKFTSMARQIISDKQVERLIDTVNHLEELDDLKELTRDFAKESAPEFVRSA